LLRIVLFPLGIAVTVKGRSRKT